MFRLGATFTLFLGLAAWAGAQGPAARSAADELQLLHANRGLLDTLIDDSVKLADAGSAVDRAAACQHTAERLADAVEQAATAGNADRVTEIGGHLGRMVRDGLKRSLDEQVPPESPDSKRLEEIRKKSIDALGKLGAALDGTGQFAETEKVQKLRQEIEALRGELKK